MTTTTTYLTTAIPYVNGAPHVGHALELVQTDALARHGRLRGEAVRALTGTDDHAIKNVRAAAAAGEAVGAFVAERVVQFAALAPALDLSFDDFISTSRDARHRPAVEALWERCAAGGDIYEREYVGNYCSGCETFLADADLDDGRCAEHRRPPDRVEERNWFFRLSKYERELLALVESGRLRIEPAHRRNEVLAFVRGGLTDFSVSRPRERSDGWGIPVPGDPTQTIYVWFDALVNYISALGYARSSAAPYEQWWRRASARRHVIGKGILRFHAVYWPAMLLSAGEPLPTDILVHEYLTVDGVKIGKSLGNAVNVADLAARYGADALRWWFLAEPPRVGDADFSEATLVAVANRDLANGVGNLAARTRRLVARYGVAGDDGSTGAELDTVVRELPGAIDRALAGYDFRAATDAIRAATDAANRHLERTEPWRLGRADPDAAAVALAPVTRALAALATELAPFTPSLAARVRHGSEHDGPVYARFR